VDAIEWVLTLSIERLNYFCWFAIKNKKSNQFDLDFSLIFVSYSSYKSSSLSKFFHSLTISIYNNSIFYFRMSLKS